MKSPGEWSSRLPARDNMPQMNPHRTWLLWGWSKRDWSHNLNSTLYFWNILYGARLSWVHSRSLFSSGHLADQSLGFSEHRFLILCLHPRIIHHPRVWAAPGQCQGTRYCLVGQEKKDRGRSRGDCQRFKLAQVKKLLSSQLYPKGITTKANHLKPSSVVYYKLGNSSTSLSYDFLVPARGTVSISGFAWR